MQDVKEVLTRYSRVDFECTPQMRSLVDCKHPDPLMDRIIENEALGLRGKLGYRLQVKVRVKRKTEMHFYTFSPFSKLKQESQRMMLGAMAQLPDTEFYYHLVELHLLEAIYGRKVDKFFIVHVAACKTIEVPYYPELTGKLIADLGLIKPTPKKIITPQQVSLFPNPIQS